MKEKNFQTLFTQWARENPPGVSTAWELKLEKGKSMLFSRVAPHQIEGLLNVKHRGQYHKISDMPLRAAGKAGFMRFGKPKPFDCLYLSGEAYVVVLFYVPREPKVMHFIDIDVWIKETQTSDRKSLTKDRSKEIAAFVKCL